MRTTHSIYDTSLMPFGEDLPAIVRGDAAISYLKDGFGKLPSLREVDDVVVQHICEMLQFQPLALSLARRTCEAASLSLADYRTLLANKLGEDVPDLKCPKEVFAAFSVAFELASREEPKMTELVELWAVGSPHTTDLFELLVPDRLSVAELNNAGDSLSRYGFAYCRNLRDPARDRRFVTHRHIIASARTLYRDRLAEIAIFALSRMSPMLGTVENGIAHEIKAALEERLMEHARYVVDLVPDDRAHFEYFYDMLLVLGFGPHGCPIASVWWLFAKSIMARTIRRP
jgi:hypothetical protein